MGLIGRLQGQQATVFLKEGDDREAVLRLQSSQVNALVRHDARPGPVGPRGSESGGRPVSRGAMRMDGIMRGLMSASLSSSPVW